MFRMMRKFLLTAIFICGLSFSGNSQTSVAFRKIDSTHAFKDIIFGSSFTLAEKMMGLKKYAYNPANQYTITDAKYLTIGPYTIVSGFAFFSKNNLYSVRLLITAGSPGTAFKEVIKYFTAWFGKPENREGAYVWFGNKVIFSIKDVKSNAVIDMQSRMIEFPQ